MDATCRGRNRKLALIFCCAGVALISLELAGIRSSRAQIPLSAAALSGGSAPVIAVTPVSGPPGTNASVTGANYGHNEGVVVYWEDPQVLATPQTDATGAFTAAVTIPTTAPNGLDTITAVGQTSGLSASANFVVASTPISAPSSRRLALRLPPRQPMREALFDTQWRQATYLILVVSALRPHNRYSANISTGRCAGKSAVIGRFPTIVADEHHIGITSLTMRVHGGYRQWHIELRPEQPARDSDLTISRCADGIGSFSE